jgi:hypothetical protein
MADKSSSLVPSDYPPLGRHLPHCAEHDIPERKIVTSLTTPGQKGVFSRYYVHEKHLSGRDLAAETQPDLPAR